MINFKFAFNIALAPGGTYTGPFDPYPGYISGSIVARRRRNL